MWETLYSGVDRPHVSGRYITFNRSVIDTILDFRQLKGTDSEAGGILLGRLRANHLEVTDLSTPMKGDYRSRVHFRREDPGHKAFGEQVWVQSNRQKIYLGEWHTHPQKAPTPSSLDFTEWAKIQAKWKEQILFVIGGLDQVGLGGLKKAAQKKYELAWKQFN